MDRSHPGVADIDDFESRLSEGISADLCRSAAKLTEAGKGLMVSVSWTMTRPHLQEVGQRVAVASRLPDVAVLDEAARVLSDRQERTDEEIEGYCLAAGSGQNGPDGDGNRQGTCRREGGFHPSSLRFAGLQEDHACPRSAAERVT